MGEVLASVARCQRTPPYVAKRKGLVFGISHCLRSESNRSIVVICNYKIARYVGTITGKKPTFTPLSILFRPHQNPTPSVWFWWRRRVLPPGPIGLLR